MAGPRVKFTSLCFNTLRSTQIAQFYITHGPFDLQRKPNVPNVPNAPNVPKTFRQSHAFSDKGYSPKGWQRLIYS